jgi:hypothetical protein
LHCATLLGIFVHYLQETIFHNLNGVKIYVYTNDHNPPHFHAKHAEHEALIVIQTLEVYAGSLPSNKLKAVRKWAATCQANLLAEFIALNPGLRGG